MEWVALIAVVILWRVHSSRTKQLRERISNLETAREQMEGMLRQLTRRVFELEGGKIQATTAPVVQQAHPVVREAPPVVVPPPPQPEPRPLPIPAPAARQQEPQGPTLEDRVRERLRGVDWEAMIGGSWLNAAGVLILVVGIALFLGYALTQLGPAGKVAIGIGVSLAMLIGGVVVERKANYIVFGRGLLAGGWASLYFTTYAMHAIDAARIVESPVAGGGLLLLVASGMIGHSLRYHSQNLTLLAYFSAFFALQIGPMTWLSILACIPLSISLLTISRMLGWTNIPIYGMVLTYFTFAFRYRPEELTPFFGAGALFTYWIAFEIHDLLKLRAAAQRSLTEMTVFPLNAFLLIGTSMLTLPSSTPVAASNFLGTAAVFFLASTVLRMRWKAVLLPAANRFERLLADSHRFAISFAAALFAAAIMRRFSTDRSVIGLLMEAQLLVLAGLRFGDRFFCHAGAVVFALPVLLMAAYSPDFGTVHLGSHNFDGWVPYAAFLALQYYCNRWLTRSGPYYTWGSLLLLLAASGEFFHNNWTAVAWIGIGSVLTEIYRRTGLREFFYQAATAAVLGFIGAVMIEQWAVAACGAVLLYLGALRLDRREDDAFIALGTVLAGVAMWRGLPAPLVAMGWGLLGLILMELGYGVSRRWLQLQAHILCGCAFGRLFVANFPIFSSTGEVSHRLLTVVPVVVLAWHAWRRTEGVISSLYSWCGVVVLGSLLRFELGRDFAVIGWAALMLALIHLGRSLGNRDFVWQGYALAALTFGRGWATNFSSNILMGIAVIASFHGAQFRLSRDYRYGRPALALMGSALLSILLYYEISGGLLTIALGAQAVGMLAAGFATQERVLRLSGLAMFGICVLKLFFYDLRNLETLSRILSFIVLGLVLMGASWLYMRFKDKIQRYL